MLTALNKSQVDRIKRFQGLFEWVQERTGVPWRVVATIWFRETFSFSPPSNKGGPFQLDPPPNATKLDRLFQRYTDLAPPERQFFAAQGVSYFLTGALACACTLRDKIEPVLNETAPEWVIKEAFFAYNGRGYPTSDESPYVMNGYDAQHLNMRGRGTIDGGPIHEWREVKPGAMVIFKQLQEQT